MRIEQSRPSEKNRPTVLVGRLRCLIPFRTYGEHDATSRHSFLHDVMPPDEWRDLGIAVVNCELARLDVEEANEKLAAAEAAVRLKQVQYGV